jgi:hypothetical protein
MNDATIKVQDLRDAVLRQCTYPGAERHSGQRLRAFIHENPEIVKLCGEDWAPDISPAFTVFKS